MSSPLLPATDAATCTLNAWQNLAERTFRSPPLREFSVYHAVTKYILLAKSLIEMYINLTDKIIFTIYNSDDFLPFVKRS